MSKVIFSIVETKKGIKAEIEGTGGELINLLANVIDESDEIREIVELSLLAVKLKTKAENKEDDFLSEVISKMKPTAQA